MNLPLYFISDIHLMDETSDNYPQISKNLENFFNHISNTGGTLFINGDLFDFYFEYKDVIPKKYFSLYNQLYTLKNTGVEIHYILGNHDYWVMDFIEKQKCWTHTTPTSLKTRGWICLPKEGRRGAGVGE